MTDKIGWIVQDTLSGQVYKVLPHGRFLELKKNFTMECPDCHKESLIIIPCGYALRLIESKPPNGHIIAVAGGRVCLGCLTVKYATDNEKKPLKFIHDEMDLLMCV